MNKDRRPRSFSKEYYSKLTLKVNPHTITGLRAIVIEK